MGRLLSTEDRLRKRLRAAARDLQIARDLGINALPPGRRGRVIKLLRAAAQAQARQEAEAKVQHAQDALAVTKARQSFLSR